MTTPTNLLLALQRANAQLGMESGRQRSLTDGPRDLRALIPTDRERAWAPAYGQRFSGDCYPRAGLFIADNFPELPPETQVVHGVLHLTGVAHAWVELPELRGMR